MFCAKFVKTRFAEWRLFDSVGKTSLMNQYIHDKFSKSYKPTIGADFLTKEIVVDDKIVTMQIWDTAGQERFRSLGGTFFRGAGMHANVLYDITNQSSFDALDSWMNEFFTHADTSNSKDFPFLVLGNKADVAKAERKISEAAARQWCQNKNGLPFLETSAKDNVNVEQAFQTIIRNALRTEGTVSLNFTSKDVLGLGKKEEPEKKTGCC
ncbi:hypothetical protein RFI_16399 [Reticulomyxa filosa]|uniref:Ras-related protein Rab-7b n=1 Tax=Reticulomyxa filosa TaxID=46433 RepID=X6N4H5_RETFI|nr:hypothetical protein RFI_16399 [Reticulomyxa filosa]|eukprot:ETO20818.1 hypothetical protein RFI_16399 [Reticulomyxa filosa]